LLLFLSQLLLFLSPVRHIFLLQALRIKPFVNPFDFRFHPFYGGLNFGYFVFDLSHFSNWLKSSGKLQMHFQNQNQPKVAL